MRSQFPNNPRYLIKQASVWTTLGNQAKRVGQYGKGIFMHDGKFNPVQGVPRALKRGYESTAAATSSAKAKNMTADALEHMLQGKAVSDVATGMKSGGPIRQYLRDKGWLSVGRKTTGRYSKEQQDQIRAFLDSKGALRKNQGGALSFGNTPINEKMSKQELDKILAEARQKFTPAQKASFGDKVIDTAYNVLPGEKSMLVGFGGLGVGSELASTHTSEGRKKSLAERVGRAGTVGAVETLAAPLGIARRFGALGIAGEGLGTMAAPMAMEAVDRKIGNPAMRKQASFPRSPRLALRRALK